MDKETLRYKSIAFIVFIALSLLGTNFAEAHRSGCHRWHSCPSDTGSYICGDLGYPCKYPTYPKSGGVILPNTKQPSLVDPQKPTSNSSLQASAEQIKIQELQKQIKVLLQQIADLQAQLAKSKKR